MYLLSIDLDPQEDWIRVEAVPSDEKGYFQIMNPDSSLFLTANEQLSAEKEISGKFRLNL